MGTVKDGDRIERWLGLYQKMNNNEKPHPHRVWLFCVTVPEGD